PCGAGFGLRTLNCAPVRYRIGLDSQTASTLFNSRVRVVTWPSDLRHRFARLKPSIVGGNAFRRRDSAEIVNNRSSVLENSIHSLSEIEKLRHNSRKRNACTTAFRKLLTTA